MKKSTLLEIITKLFLFCHTKDSNWSVHHKKGAVLFFQNDEIFVIQVHKVKSMIGKDLTKDEFERMMK